MIINRTDDDVVYLTYESLLRTGLVRHGVSTRCGGKSSGFLGTMNLSYSRGDDDACVTENFRRISKAIGFEADSMVFTDQTHTTNVMKVTKEHRGCGFNKDRGYSDIDGLVTNVPGLTLSIFTADCVPLLFVDPVKRVVGASHSGWRGTVGRIGAKTVELMASEYQSNPADIIAVIGPSICKECYEVSEDVADEFKKEFDVKYHDVIMEPGKEAAKYQLDLHEANRIILMEAGVLKSNISMPGICTCHNPQFLFSHRASYGKRGNLGAFIQLI